MALHKQQREKKYSIVQFSDGLQVVPTCWLNNNKSKCNWPGHVKTLNTLHKLIRTAEIPKESWEECEVVRYFGCADNWMRAQEKMREAEDTSHLIESDDLSENELALALKNHRRKKARKIMSSDGDSSDELQPKKKMPKIIEDIILPLPPSTQSEKATLSKDSTTDSVPKSFIPQMYSTPMNSSLPTENTQNRFTSNNYEAHENVEHSCDHQNNNEYTSDHVFRKYVTKTLASLVMQVADLNEKVNILLQTTNKINPETSVEDEFQRIPIVQNINELQEFEEKLKDPSFFRKTLKSCEDSSFARQR